MWLSSARFSLYLAHDGAKVLSTPDCSGWMLAVTHLTLHSNCHGGMSHINSRTEASPVIPKRGNLQSILPFLGIGYLVVVWGLVIWRRWSLTGLFSWLGTDYGLFHAAADTFRANGPGTVYDLDMLGRYLAPMHSYYDPAMILFKVYPVPYPPIFTLVVMPFSMLPPVAGWLLWMLVNAGLCAYVARDIAKNAAVNVWSAVPTALLSIPVMVGLLVGQPVGFLLLFFYKAYRALQRGDDLQSGMWIGLLLIKPQLAVGLLFVLLWKRRWRALAGAALTRGTIAISSFAILGVDGLIAFYRTVLGHASGPPGFGSTIVATDMISWHGLVSVLGYGMPESQAIALTLLLTVITLAILPVIWRGEWQPRGDRFALQMLATGIVTMLVGYDMHVHGATLLVVPAMILVTRREGPWIVPVVVNLSLFMLPLLAMYLPLLALLFAMLLILTLVAIIIGELVRERGVLSPAPDIGSEIQAQRT